MADDAHLRAIRRRMLAALLLVSLVSLAVLAVGTVGPHLLARAGRHEAIDTGWLVAATGVAVLTAIVASLVVAHRLLGPLRKILVAGEDFSSGNHSARVPDLGRPELAPLVESLNAAAAAVQQSELRRQRLTADVAHELRTPLTALQAGLEELRDGLVPPEPAALAALHDQAVRLSRIVSDLSDLSAAESEGLHLELEPIDLGALAERAVTARERVMSTAGLTVGREVSSGVVVRGDADRLHQVVGNLLANCTAYCRPGDRVDVRVRRNGRRGILEVADTGPGLDDVELASAFDRRWRGRDAATTPGSGLGLPIVRALVAAHGGEVDLSSSPGAGTVVRVALPLAGAD